MLDDKMGIRAWAELSSGEMLELTPAMPRKDSLLQYSAGSEYGQFDEGAILCMPSLECGKGAFVYYAHNTEKLGRRSIDAVHFLAYRGVNLPRHYSYDPRTPDEIDEYETSYWFATRPYMHDYRWPDIDFPYLVIAGVPGYELRVDDGGNILHKTFASGDVRIDESVYARQQATPRLSYMNKEKFGDGHWNHASPNVGITYVTYPFVDTPDWSKSRLWKLAEYLEADAIDSLPQDDIELLSYVWWIMRGGVFREKLDYLVWCRAFRATERPNNVAGPKWILSGLSHSQWFMRIIGDDTYGPEKNLFALNVPGAKSVFMVPRFYMGDCMPDSKEAAESILGRNHAYEAALRSEWFQGFGACMRGIHPSAAGGIDDVRRMSRQELLDFKPDSSLGSVNMMRRHSIAYRYTRHGWMTYAGYPALRIYASLLAGPCAFVDPFEWQYSAVPMSAWEQFTYKDYAFIGAQPAPPSTVSPQQFLQEITAAYDNDVRMHKPSKRLFVPGGPSDQIPSSAKVWHIGPQVIPAAAPMDPPVRFVIQDSLDNTIVIDGGYEIQ